jgi:hypothetical protein
MCTSSVICNAQEKFNVSWSIISWSVNRTKFHVSDYRSPLVLTDKKEDIFQ